jgi:hypothetical protein
VDIPGGQVGPCAASFVLMLNVHRVTGPRATEGWQRRRA